MAALDLVPRGRLFARPMCRGFCIFARVVRHCAWLVIAAVLAACGDRKPPSPVATDHKQPPAPSSVASIAPSTPSPVPAVLPPARNLLAAIPADAAFAFVTLDPSDLPKRFLAELDMRAV